MKKIKNFVANNVIIFGGFLGVLSEKIIVWGFGLHKKFKTETGEKIIQVEETLKAMAEQMAKVANAQAQQPVRKLNLPADQNTGESDGQPKPFLIKTPGNS